MPGRHLRFDCFSGISGDMVLGALIDVGADPKPLVQLPGTLGLTGVTVEIERVIRGGITGTKVTVASDDTHSHRHYSHIRDLVGKADLPDAAKDGALQTFAHLAEVEGAIHGIDPERVHFHEVGAWDSIVDVVGAHLLLTSLKIDSVSTSAIATGSGTVQTAHGILPIPAPATLRLLEGFATVPGDVPFELVTPTGAALLRTWVLSPKRSEATAGRVLASGYGAGSRDLKGRANVLRATVLTGDAPSNLETVCTLETHIDDLNPEIAGAIIDLLHEAGALDAYALSAFGKGNRPGLLFQVVCLPDAVETLEGILYRETSTLGIRRRYQERTLLEREGRVLETPWGDLRYKVAFRDGAIVNVAAEHRDCRKLARKSGKPLQYFYDLVAAEGLRLIP